jgi:L-aminopeptidase/D-esterase-like protein
MFRLSRLVLATILVAGSAGQASADQSTLSPVLNAGGRVLEFDWPAIEVGTGEYAEGPTGVTVIRFPRRAYAAVDVRGGGPGTVNTDYLRLGYDAAELDAVVFSGGSWYGLEATTAVASALKDDGIRDGDWNNLALAVGAIIYDLGPRRLNEIYPDKRLAQAAFRAARPGVVPLGAQGEGRFAKTGALFGCNAYSGQGAAYRQLGELKLAAFAVVNALGVVTTRDGRVAACYRDAGWPLELRTTDLLAHYPASGKPGSPLGVATEQGRRNTTVSLVVTNQKLAPAELQRLATHVHSSMSRAIQPFATEFDGDVLYAVSTGEWQPTEGKPGWPTVELDVVAAEVMWDAVLASVPEQPRVAKPAQPGAATSVGSGRTGEYVFSPQVSVRITATTQGTLQAQATGNRDAYAIGRTAPVLLEPVTPDRFTVPGRYPLVLEFRPPDQLVINPGHWQQTGLRRLPQ